MVVQILKGPLTKIWGVLRSFETNSHGLSPEDVCNGTQIISEQPWKNLVLGIKKAMIKEKKTNCGARKSMHEKCIPGKFDH